MGGAGNVEHLGKRLCGRRIRSFDAARHIHAGQESLVEIGITDDEGQTYRLRCHSDGWGLAVDEGPPAGIDMGSFGAVEVSTAGVLLNRVDRAFSIRVRESDQPFGVLLIGQGKQRVLIFNWGDELYLETETPELLSEATYDLICDATAQDGD
jgi:hypothetical protein